MKELFLVDGSGYIFRAFYAIAPLSTAKGLPTNALFGFTRMLMKLLRDSAVEYVAVAFDTDKATFRHELFDDYKGNRAETPTELVPQLPYFRTIVEALGIQSLELPGFEADDIIATLADKLASEETKVTIISGDKDLTQLVNDNILVWDAMRDTRFDAQKVQEKFGVRPEQIGDYLALVGDSSDNVPGLKGVGAKTAQAILNALGSLQVIINTPQRLREVPGIRGVEKIIAAIEAGKEEVLLSRKLVELERNVKPYSEIRDVESFRWHGPLLEKLEAVAKELEFSKLLGDLSGGRAQKQQRVEAVYAKKDFRLIERSSWQGFLNDLQQQKSFAFDTETNSLDPRKCKLVGLAISWAEGQAAYLPLWSELEPERVLDAEMVQKALAPIFNDPTIKKVGFNLKYDIGVLATHGYEVHGVCFDAMLASHLLEPERRGHSLKALSKHYLEQEMLSYEDVLGEALHLGEVPLEQVGLYCCHDAESSWCLYLALDALLGPRIFGAEEGASLRRVFEDVEMPLVVVLAEMEQAGIKVDCKLLSRLQQEFARELAQLEQEIQALAGLEFNLNSPKQLSEVLFEKLKLPSKGVRRMQSYLSTDASVLSMLAPKHPIAAKLLDYRELFKLQTTYIEALSKLADPITARIHASFNQGIVSTGRLSSSEPNLQNIPIRSARGKSIRSAFIAEEGSKLISADYSQIELRLLAHLSADEALCEAFARGEDIHMRTARELFGAAAAEGPDAAEHRRYAKTINFGVIYGMSAFRLAGELGISRGDAQRFIDGYFSRYPRVREYYDSLEAMAQRQGYVESLFGRRRYLREVESAGRDSGYVQRSLLNAPIQGSAAEVMKVAMSKFHNELCKRKLPARILLQVHDELVVETEQRSAPEISALLKTSMENAVKLRVPLQVEIGMGNSWGELS